MHLSAGGEYLEENGFEGAARPRGLAFGPFGGAGGGCAGGAWKFDGGGVGQEKGVDVVAELRGKGEKGERGAVGFA